MAATSELGSRQRLLQAAEHLFHLTGYQGTSVDDVLVAAKVTKSNFYYHFKSKEVLGLAVLDRWAEEMLQKWLIPTLSNASLTPLVRLRSLVTFFADQMEASDCHRGCPFGKLAHELSREHSAFRRSVNHYFEQLVDWIWAVLVEGQRAGQIRQGDARVLAEMFVAQLEGAILLAKMSKHTRTIRTCFDVLADLLAVRTREQGTAY